MLELLALLFLGFLLLVLIFGALYSICSPTPSFKTMSYDEEVEWLMKDHGLSRKEAEEIADL